MGLTTVVSDATVGGLAQPGRADEVVVLADAGAVGEGAAEGVEAGLFLAGLLWMGG